MIIDTHCHLFEPEYDEDRDEMMSRARAAGVEHFVLPNINVESIERLHRMAENDPEHCHAAMGLHPTELTEHATENLEVIHAHLQSRSYCAVGEIGLDYYWDDSGKDLADTSFRATDGMGKSNESSSTCTLTECL